MPTEPKKPLIVISYAHADEPEQPAAGEIKWLSFVRRRASPPPLRGRDRVGGRAELWQ